MAGGGVKLNNITVNGGADGATFVPSVDANGNLSWTNNKGYTNPTTVNIKGADGDDGQDGSDGRGIVSIVKTSTSGLVDTYTITYTDNTASTFTVTNGSGGGDEVIVRQDLTASFTPVANTYYLHTGTTTTDFVNGGIYFYHNNEFSLCGDHPLRVIKGGTSSNPVSIFSFFANPMGLNPTKRGVAFAEGYFTDLPSLMPSIVSNSFFIEFEYVGTNLPATLTITYKNYTFIAQYDSAMFTWGSWQEYRTVTSIDMSIWNGKSVVSASDTGTATDEIQYITVNGVEKKIAGGTAVAYPTSAEIENILWG